MSWLITQKGSMSLKQQVMEDMKTALKERQADVLETLRYLLAQIKNVEIDLGEQSDEGVIGIIHKQVKEIREALSEFERGGRADLVESERKKLAVLERYLPSPLTAIELEATVKEVVDALTEKSLGPAIQAVRAKVAGRAQGGDIAAAVKKYLGM